MITALTSPTGGEILINGHRTSRDSTGFKTMVGLVPQHINLETELTVEENLRLHGMLYGMDRHEITARITRI